MVTVAKRAVVKTAKHKMDSMNVTKITGHACMVVKMATGLKLALKLARRDVFISCAMRRMASVYMVAYQIIMGVYVNHNAVNIALMNQNLTVLVTNLPAIVTVLVRMGGMRQTVLCSVVTVVIKDDVIKTMVHVCLNV